MTNELDSWSKATAEAAVKMDGVMRQQSDRLHQLFEDYGSELGHRRQDGVAYDVIQEFDLPNRNGWGYGGDQAFFLRRRTNTEVLPDVECLVEHKDGRNQRLLFKVDTGIVFDLDSPTEEFTDTTLVDRLIEGAKTDLSKRKAEHRQQQHQFRKRFVGSLLSLLMLTGIGYGIDWLSSGPNETAIAKAFDKEHVELPGQFFTPVQTAPINFISTAEWNKIPDFKNGDSLRTPAIISIGNAEQCVDTESPINIGDRVAISDTYGNDDDVTVARNIGGALSICRLDTNSGDAWTYAVQIFDGTVPRGIKTEAVSGPITHFISSALYNSVPNYNNGDSLKSPRLVTINNPESCINTSTPLVEGQVVNLADEVGNVDNIIVVQNQGDALSVCRLDDESDGWSTVIQVKQ